MTLNKKKCPFCGSKNLIYDEDRCETYCNDCGTVLSMPYDFVGGRKVLNPFSFNYFKDLKKYIHLPTWIFEEDLGKYGTKEKLNYTHNIPDWRLMKKGLRREAKY